MESLDPYAVNNILTRLELRDVLALQVCKSLNRQILLRTLLKSHLGRLKMAYAPDVFSSVDDLEHNIILGDEKGYSCLSRVLLIDRKPGSDYNEPELKFATRWVAFSAYVSLLMRDHKNLVEFMRPRNDIFRPMGSDAHAADGT